MKTVILALGLVLSSTVSYADESTRDSSRNNSGIRNEYDDLMKSSGKWDFIGSSAIVLGVLAGATSVYAYQRGDYYRDREKHLGLTPHEQDEKMKWKNLCDGAGYGAAGLLGFGLFGVLMEVHYENRAHQFALDMGVKF